MARAPTAVVLLVAADGTEVAVGRLGDAAPDLGVLDALLRLEVVARRSGRTVAVRDASPALLELVELAGVAGCLRLEPPREAEGLEQRGVDEVVQPGDPAA